MLLVNSFEAIGDGCFRGTRSIQEADVKEPSCLEGLRGHRNTVFVSKKMSSIDLDLASESHYIMSSSQWRGRGTT